jgi:transcriptional regulator with XRE-family HTH domain
MNGHDLKVERVKANLQARQIAEAMGVHSSTVTRIEQRIFLDPDVIDRYLKAIATCSTLSTSTDGRSAA